MKIGTFDIRYTSNSNVNYSGTITKEGRIERLERIDSEVVPNLEYTEVWANYFETEGKLVYETTQDPAATESWDITDGLDIDTIPWGDVWNNTDEGTTINDYEYQSKITKIVIKDELYPKTTGYMFCDLDNVTNIEGLDKVLDNITDIGEGMFLACGGLGDLDLSAKNIANIGDLAFAYSSLTSIVLPNTLKTIKESAFSSCNLESINIPEGVTSIEGEAFGSCCELREVSLPNSLTSIGNIAFWGTPLTSITIPANVKTIGEKCFLECGLTEVHYNAINASENTFSRDDQNTPFYGVDDDYSEIRKLVIGKDVKVIPKDMFAGMIYLDTVIFESPSSLETIEEFAFSECFDEYEERIELHIPSSIAKIEENAFLFTPDNLYIYIDKEEGSLNDDSWEIDLENPIHWKDN